MQRTGRRDTACELALRSAVHGLGFRYRVDWAVPGTRTRADLTFLSARVLVFVDGCFWHGCPRHATWPKANAYWWRAKIEANRERDARNTAALKRLGWTVIRVWEHEAPERAARRIASVVRRKNQAT
jgi:DNA mismatch endonuclease (patch repair protein)